ncbi:unnamed protein product [Arctogadus glacialis]
MFIFQNENQRDSDSAVTLDPTPAKLRRTDSVLTKEMLGSKGCSLSSTDGSEEEYFPAASSSSEEEDSDEDQPVKRKGKLKTYKRRKESVKNSDSLVIATTRSEWVQKIPPKKKLLYFLPATPIQNCTPLGTHTWG